MSRYYVTAVVVVEATCADEAVNAVAIAVHSHAVKTAAYKATLTGLDVEGEPILEVCVEEINGPVLVDPDNWTLREVPT